MIIGLSDPNCVIDKYQSGALTTCNSPTNATSNCLNVDRVCGHFTVASLVAVSDLVIFLGVATENIFSSVKEMMLISLISATVLNG